MCAEDYWNYHPSSIIIRRNWMVNGPRLTWMFSFPFHCDHPTPYTLLFELPEGGLQFFAVRADLPCSKSSFRRILPSIYNQINQLPSIHLHWAPPRLLTTPTTSSWKYHPIYTSIVAVNVELKSYFRRHHSVHRPFSSLSPCPKEANKQSIPTRDTRRRFILDSTITLTYRQDCLEIQVWERSMKVFKYLLFLLFYFIFISSLLHPFRFHCHFILSKKIVQIHAYLE